MLWRNLVASVVSFSKLSNLSEIKFMNYMSVRSLRTRGNRSIGNPRVNSQLEEGFTEEDVYDELVGEIDVNKTRLSRQEFDREEERHNHFVRVKIIENKYFKPKKEPSLLTWEEKEQIRNLHELNPEKWNVHTLAESFPATERIIMKVLKARWKPSSALAIKLHNERVIKNWQKLSEGKLDVSDETYAHLSRFSSRRKVVLPPTDSSAIQAEELNIVPTSVEFSSIIQSKKSRELIADPSHDTKRHFFSNFKQNDCQDETYVVGDSKTSGNLITLNKYREKVLQSNKPLDIFDKSMIDGYKAGFEKCNELKKPNISSTDFQTPKYSEHSIEQTYEKGVIRDFITIPSHLKRKGNLYKLEDCYYDEDGELLYRVPGMG